MDKDLAFFVGSGQFYIPAGREDFMNLVFLCSL